MNTTERLKDTTETVQMLVTVKIVYNTKRARADALKAARENLHCFVYASGVDGSFSAQSGRVVLLRSAA